MLFLNAIGFAVDELLIARKGRTTSEELQTGSFAYYVSRIFVIIFLLSIRFLLQHLFCFCYRGEKIRRLNIHNVRTGYKTGVCQDSSGGKHRRLATKITTVNLNPPYCQKPGTFVPLLLVP